MLRAVLVSVSTRLIRKPSSPLLEQRELVAVRRDLGDRAADVGRLLDLVLDEAVLDHQLGRRHAEVGAQARGVALVLRAAPS